MQFQLAPVTAPIQPYVNTDTIMDLSANDDPFWYVLQNDCCAMGAPAAAIAPTADKPASLAVSTHLGLLQLLERLHRNGVVILERCNGKPDHVSTIKKADLRMHSLEEVLLMDCDYAGKSGKGQNSAFDSVRNAFRRAGILPFKRDGSSCDWKSAVLLWRQ
jgi:hypothetical protein